MESPASVTTRDLSKAAGVSQPTVSRALRGDPRISAATRERVQALAKKMGYVPNPLISALMSSQRRSRRRTQEVVAFLTSFRTRDDWKTNATHREFHEGAQKQAARYGYEMEDFWLREPRMTSRRMSEIFFHRNVHGVVVGPLPTGRGHLSLEWSGIAAVAIGYSMIRPRLHRVSHDNFGGMRNLLRQLVKRGYRRIGLVLRSSVSARVNYHWSGAYAEYQMTLPAESRLTPFIHEPELFNSEQIVSWARKERPDAIAVADASTSKWLRDAGYRIPEEIGVCYLDWIDDSGYAYLNQNSAAVGAAAVDLVIGQLNRNERGLPEIPKTTLVDGFLVEGSSLRPLLP
jgi:LacI family transcriptional regulator